VPKAEKRVGEGCLRLGGITNRGLAGKIYGQELLQETVQSISPKATATKRKERFVHDEVQPAGKRDGGKRLDLGLTEQTRR